MIASRRVMRQSLFAPEATSVADAGLQPPETGLQTSRLLIYALAVGGAALLVAVIALIVALLR